MSLSRDRRREVIAEVARLLPQRNGRLGRLLWRHARGDLPRGMTSVLATLEDGPETISRLADKEGTAQPTLTRIIQRLEADRLVRRSAQPRRPPRRRHRADPGGGGRARRDAGTLSRRPHRSARPHDGRAARAARRGERRRAGADRRAPRRARPVNGAGRASAAATVAGWRRRRKHGSLRVPASCSRSSRSAAAATRCCSPSSCRRCPRCSRSSTRPRRASRGSSRRTSSPPRSRRRSPAASATCSGRSGRSSSCSRGSRAGRCSRRSRRRLPLLILARTIQGLGGAVFPLAFGIIRDEFPRERVPGSIGLISGLLGIGGALGIVLAGPILAHLDYHWLFWIPFGVVRRHARRDAVSSSPSRRSGLPAAIDWARRRHPLRLARLPAPPRSARRLIGAGPRRGRSGCSPSRPCSRSSGSRSSSARRARSST